MTKKGMILKTCKWPTHQEHTQSRIRWTKLTITFLLATQTLRLEMTQSFSAEGPSKVTKTESWSKQMRSLYLVLSELLTDALSKERFEDPARQAIIEKNTKRLSELAHSIEMKSRLLDSDPTYRIIGESFARESRQVFDTWKMGSREYARDVLRTLPGHCIACHTRNETGPSFSKLPLEPAIKTIKPIELAEFYAATRQFDRSDRVLKEFLGSKTNGLLPWIEWQKAIQLRLAMAIRVKKDPELALQIVRQVFTVRDSPGSMFEYIPEYIKEDASKWEKSILEWKSEATKEIQTVEGLYREAVRLVGRARQMQKYPMDRSADIYYLRASSLLHTLLQVTPKGAHTAEALLLLGMCYEVLRPFQLYELQEPYYEACIQAAPQTETSRSCFRRFEQSVVIGFTGSSGTQIPEDMKKRLRDLKHLSYPKGPQIQN